MLNPPPCLPSNCVCRASEREEMLAGKLYNSVDPELNALREKAGDLCARFNAASRTDHAARAAILDELLPGHGAGLDVMGPIFFDYGCNITIGERVFANFNFTVLDCCPVTIGDDVLFADVSLLPPMHPLRWQDRNVSRHLMVPHTTASMASRLSSARTAGLAAM